MKRILLILIIAAGAGLSLSTFRDGFTVKIPRIDVPAGKAYCRFVPDPQNPIPQSSK